MAQSTCIWERFVVKKFWIMEISKTSLVDDGRYSSPPIYNVQGCWDVLNTLTLLSRGKRSRNDAEYEDFHIQDIISVTFEILKCPTALTQGEETWTKKRLYYLARTTFV